MDTKTSGGWKFGLLIVLLMTILVLVIVFFVTGILSPLVASICMMLVSIAMAICVCAHMLGIRKTTRSENR